MTVQGITEHQKALQNIADLNGGTRYTRTPGYTASAAYVKATLEKAGYDVRYEMFNMPDWHETAPPVLQQVSPTSKTYKPRAAPRTTTRRRSTSSPSSTRRRSRCTNVKVVADQRHRDPEPGRHHRRLRDVGLPGGDERRGRR